MKPQEGPADDGLMTLHEYTVREGLTPDRATRARIGKRAADLLRAQGVTVQYKQIKKRGPGYARLACFPQAVLEQAFRETRP